MVVCEIKGNERWPIEITKFHDKNFGGDRYVHYHVCGDSVMNIYLCQNIILYP